MRAALLVGALLLTNTAQGYVRSRTDKGIPLAWRFSCVDLHPSTHTSHDLTPDALQRLIAQAVANWQTPTLTPSCSYFTIQLGPPVEAVAKLDKVNVIDFRGEKWCHPPERTGKEVCYAPQAAGITTVFYNVSPGQEGAILDADILFNEVHFTFVSQPTDRAPRDGTALSDLENTLVHELGHFQGLDHTCWDHVTANAPIDDDGRPVPDCEDVANLEVPDEEYRRITQSSMFNFATSMDTGKRTPESDDVRAICEIYIRARDPGAKEGHCGAVAEEPPGACSVAAEPPHRRRTAPWALGALALPLLWIGRRLRRSR